MSEESLDETLVQNEHVADLIAQMREIRDKNWVAEMVLQRGSPGDTSPLSPGQVANIDHLIEETDAIQGYCFSNAQHVALYFDQVSYVEGFVYLINEDWIGDHAWVEFDGRVAELTWKERPHPPENAVYIGVRYEDEIVERVLDERLYDCTVSHWIIRRAHEETDGSELDIGSALKSLTTTEFGNNGNRRSSVH